MWLVFIFLILIIGLYFSKITINLIKLNITEKDFEFKLKISLYLFSKIKVFSFLLTENGVKYKKFLDNSKFEHNVFKILSRIKQFKIEKIKAKILIGTEDIFITVFFVTFLSSILGIYLSKQKGQFKYEILPEFGKNKIFLEGIFLISFKTRRIRIFFKSKEHTKLNKLLVGG